MTTKKDIAFGNDFNLVYVSKFELSGGNPILKKKSLVKLAEKRNSLFKWYMEDKKS